MSGTLGDMSDHVDPTASATPSTAGRPAGRDQLGRVGLWTGSLEGLTPAQLPDVLGELDDQGWGSLWFGEAVGREAFTAAQMYLGATRRMAIGTGIASIYGRDACRRRRRRTLEALRRAGSSWACACRTRRWSSGTAGIITLALSACASTSTLSAAHAPSPRGRT